MIEEWKKIKGYENYEISNFGRIKNSKGISYGYDDVYGYKFTTLYPGRKQKKIHTLVYESFNDCIVMWPMTINHKDEIKNNNILDNLELMHTADNSRYSMKGKPTKDHDIRSLRLSHRMKGVPKTEEQKIKQSNKMKGRKASAETKLKLSIAKIGNQNSRKKI